MGFMTAPNTYIISDTHFLHGKHNPITGEVEKGILIYEKRPFKTLGEMTEKLIENWNSVVSNNDTCWHLGDVGLCSKENLTKIISRLNGNKNLILGSHDTHSLSWYHDIGFNYISKYPIVYAEKYIFSHEPQLLVSKSEYKCIHGHLHSKNLSSKYDSSKYFNVSVEKIDYRPIAISKIIEYFNTLKKS